MIKGIPLSILYKIAATLSNKNYSIREAFRSHNIIMTLIKDDYTLLFQSSEQETLFRLKYSEYLQPRNDHQRPE